MQIDIANGSYMAQGKLPFSNSWRNELSSRLHELISPIRRIIDPPAGAFQRPILREDHQSCAAGDPDQGKAASMSTHQQETRHDLLVSSTAVGLALGSFVFPPLQVACLPVMAYLGLGSARRAYAERHAQHRMGVNMAETTAIVLCIAQGYYLAGSVTLSIYYLGKLAADNKDKQNQRDAAWQEPAWARVVGVDHDFPKLVRDLSPGDTIIVEAGEVIPAAGVIAGGTALVKCNKLPAHRSSIQSQQCSGDAVVTSGQKVEADMIVQLGCIHISIDPLQE